MLVNGDISVCMLNSRTNLVSIDDGISCGCKTVDPNLCVGNWWHQLDKSLEVGRHMIGDVALKLLLTRH